MTTSMIKKTLPMLLLSLLIYILSLLIVVVCDIPSTVKTVCGIVLIIVAPLLARFILRNIATYNIANYFRNRDEMMYQEMVHTVANASDEELKDLNEEFHDGIEMSYKLGDTVPNVSLRIDDLIEKEIHRRGLESCDDIARKRYEMGSSRYPYV